MKKVNTSELLKSRLKQKTRYKETIFLTEPVQCVKQNQEKVCN